MISSVKLLIAIEKGDSKHLTTHEPYSPYSGTDHNFLNILLRPSTQTEISLRRESTDMHRAVCLRAPQLLLRLSTEDGQAEFAVTHLTTECTDAESGSFKWETDALENNYY